MNGVNLLKTVIFNFRYFPLKTAIILPVIIYRKTSLCDIKGQIIIVGKVQTGMVKIGKHVVGSLDMRYERTIWSNKGKIIFYGSAQIGSGSRISVNKGATLSIGHMFCITGRSSIICSKVVSFGNNTLISWDCLIMDTDFHDVIQGTEVVNSPKPIFVGNNVWIGCRTMLLKGVEISDDTVVGAGTIITSKKVGGGIVGNNHDITTIKESVCWRR